MPRQARKKSESGIYHVVMRGINQQQIFEDDEDCEKYLQVLKEYRDICGYKIYAYCLMGNHIHLLIKAELEPLEQVFKRIGSKYVYWYNTKYRRIGPLFQDRFKSEAVNDDAYFLTVVRYIHQNPVKAELVKRPEQYRWSSYSEYLMGKMDQLTDTDLVESILDLAEFKRFHEKISDDNCLEITDIPLRLTDEQARSEIYRLSGCKSIGEFQSLEITRRDKALRQLKEQGLSLRQASRLTGVSKGIIEKIIRT